MRTKFTVAPILIISAASLRIQSAIAKRTPYIACYSHGFSDAKITFSERHISQPAKGPSFTRQEFISEHNTGLVHIVVNLQLLFQM